MEREMSRHRNLERITLLAEHEHDNEKAGDPLTDSKMLLTADHISIDHSPWGMAPHT